MSYRGTTLAVSLLNAGFNGNLNHDAIPAGSVVYPSRNINIHEGGVSKRGGTSIVDTIAAAPQIRSIFQYKTFILRICSDGKLYQDNANTIATGLANTNNNSLAVMNGIAHISNRTKPPLTWSGTGSAAALTNLSADWTGTNYPSQFLLHGSGNSERMWACGCPTSKYTVYYSADNAGSGAANFLTGGGQIPIDTGDDIGIVGLFEYNDRIWAVGSSKVYLIEDTDADDTNWSYKPASWNGGTSNRFCIVPTPNDVFIMSDDLEIFSAFATDTAQDYQTRSLTRPSFIYNWIKDNVSKKRFSSFHGVYYPVWRAVLFFFVPIDLTQVKKCLVYFIDRPVESAWAIHDDDTAQGTFSSGYTANCSAMVNIQTGEEDDWGPKLYTGDLQGKVWLLDTPVKSDNGNGYWAGLTNPSWNCGNPRIDKSFDGLRLSVKPIDNCTLNVDTYIDGESEFSQTLDIVADSSREIKEYSLDLGATGKRIYNQIYNDTAGEDFFISNIMLDFMNLGAGV